MRTDGKEKKAELRHLLEYFCGAQMYDFPCKKRCSPQTTPFLG